MELCSRCHKRVAMVFITKLENGKATNEGLCIKCAKELGIPQVDGLIKKLGISEDDLDAMTDQMGNLLDENNGEDGNNDENQDNQENNSHTPALDLRKIFGNMPINPMAVFNNAEDMAKKAAEAKQNATGTKAPNGKRKFLNMYCTDITSKAKAGEVDRVIGRERETERIIQILCRRQKNNPCLIGEPGVGKTALAEALAQRIIDGKVPHKLAKKEIFLLDMTALVAGTQFRGQFESRIKSLIEEIKADGNIILVIDEIHTISHAGDSEGSMSAGNILKPSLSKGEIQVIGATTLSEYRKYIEKDSALERRFQPVVIEEPSVEESVEILRGIKDYYEKYHGVRVPDSILEKIVVLSERYITDRFLPDKAIDLLDESCAYLVLNSPIISEYAKTKEELETANKKIKALEEQQSKPEQTDDIYEKIAQARVDALSLAKKSDELKAECEKIELSQNELANVIEIWTGIPSADITESEFERVNTLGDRLKKRIVGQDKAVDAVARAVKRSRAGISYKRKPVSFIFAGPTGVGKTELVKTLAADLFNTPESLIRLDMSEFMEKHSVSRIVGSPPGYVGYDDAGQLTEKIRRKPYSVILFDEIEKAHPDVMNILLQILDDGRISDAHGKVVNFENTIIVMTTNAGAGSVSLPVGFGETEESRADEKTMKALTGFLRPEFINRVDEIITFRSLDENNFRDIAKIMLGDLKNVLAQKNISIEYEDDVVNYVAEKSFSKTFGARNMRRFIQREIEDIIASEIIAGYNKGINKIIIKNNEGKLEFIYSSLPI